MLIYAVADIHGRRKRIAFIREKISDIRPHVLVIAGDITGLRKSEHTVSLLNQMSVPVLAIRGNSDRRSVEKYFKKYPNVFNLHLIEKQIQGFSFAGIGGTVPVPFSSRLAFREKPIIEKLDTMVDGQTILVVHPPPWGTLDEVFGRFHAGCRSLNGLVTAKGPALVICGHIHERPGAAFINKTLVVNCSIGRRGRGAVIEVEEGNTPKVDFQ